MQTENIVFFHDVETVRYDVMLDSRWESPMFAALILI